MPKYGHVQCRMLLPSTVFARLSLSLSLLFGVENFQKLVSGQLTVAGGEAKEINEGRSVIVGVQEKDVQGVGITGDEL